MSESVRTQIAVSNRKTILTFWGVSESCRAEMGHLVEDLFWEDLKKARPMKRIPLKPHASAGINLDLIIPVSNYLEGVQINELGREIFSVPENAPIIARMEKNECLIDFAGPHRNVYQITVSEDHDMQLTGLKQLLISSGHCEENNGSLMETKNASTIEKTKFH